jgi:hypothetical protein
MSPVRAATVLALSLLPACASSRPPASRPATRPAPPARMVPPRAEPAFQVGDTAEFELRLQSPDGPDRVLSLEFMFLAETGEQGVGTWQFNGVERRYQYPTGLVSVEVVQTGTPASRHQQTLAVPLPPLAQGLAGACAIGHRLKSSVLMVDGREREAVISAVFAVVALFKGLLAVKPLESVLREVADVPLRLLPSLVFGVHATITTQFEQATPMPSPYAAPWDGPCWSLPYDISLNGTLAIQGRLLVLEARPPLTVVAGLIGVEAWQPGNPERRLTAHLVRLFAPPPVQRAR